MAGRKEHKKLDRRQLMQEPFPTGIQCYSDLKVHCVWAANGPASRLRTSTSSEPHSIPRECAGRYPEISPGMLHPLSGLQDYSGALTRPKTELLGGIQLGRPQEEGG